MAECDYCGDEEHRTQGKMLVLTSGEKKFFCSGKCEKNWKQNRTHRYTDKEQ